MSFWNVTPDAAATQGSLVSQGTVLLVDDEPFVRAMTGAVLTAMGWNVINVSTGEDALKLLNSAVQRGTEIDLVILDLILPCGMSGLDVVRHIREIKPDMKVIACSGFFGDDDGASCLRMGFDALLAKPFTAEDLGQTVYRCLHSSSNNPRQNEPQFA